MWSTSRQERKVFVIVVLGWNFFLRFFPEVEFVFIDTARPRLTICTVEYEKRPDANEATADRLNSFHPGVIVAYHRWKLFFEGKYYGNSHPFSPRNFPPFTARERRHPRHHMQGAFTTGNKKREKCELCTRTERRKRKWKFFCDLPFCRVVRDGNSAFASRPKHSFARNDNWVLRLWRRVYSSEWNIHGIIPPPQDFHKTLSPFLFQYSKASQIYAHRIHIGAWMRCDKNSSHSTAKPYRRALLTLSIALIVMIVKLHFFTLV